MHLKELCLIILSIAMKLSLFLLTSRTFIFFLPASFDRSEEIDIYFNSLKLSPIDVEEDSFISDSKIIFDPSKLNINNQKMRFVAETANSNIAHNAQCFLLTKRSGVNTCYNLWADVYIEQSQNEKLKLSY